ncbi:MAG TPA: serine hydrolase domain-containing protein [Gemmatimonadaceae bacterium]|nr:serine hydrolase domain-containing protein [Gemmatimonadaceae bacterium]
MRRVTSRPRALLLALVLLLVGVDAVAQVQPTRRPRTRVARAAPADPRPDRVERSLLPAVRVAGRTYAPATIPQRLRDLGVPAVSIAVIDGGRIAWARAYGLRDVAAGDSATTRTLFQAASISKPVAATAALQLVQEGRVSLDAPVNTYLSSWRLPDTTFTASRPVTLRHLLTHTGGLTVSGFPGYARGAALPTAVQVLDAQPPANTRAVRVDTTPGVRWRYSGGGITVAQLLIADVTGKPFEVVARERVLAPAGMTASTFEQPLPEARLREAATAYRADGGVVAGGHHVYPEMAAAGLWTTPSDLARWVLELQRSLRGGRSKLLAPRTAHEMVTRGMGGWGLGVQVAGERDSLYFMHGGSNAGFRAILVGYVATGRGFVVMTNSDAGMAIVGEIAQAIAREHGFPGFGPRVLTPVPLDSAGREAFVGRYRGRTGVTAQLVVEDGSLWAVLPGGVRWELVPTSLDRLESPQGPTIRVERGADERPTALLVNDSRYERVP